MPRLNAANNARTTLTQDISNTDTSFTVNDVSKFPSAPFRITVDNEIMEVTSVDAESNIFYVQRAVESTTALPHSAGTTVENRWTAGTYAELVNAEDVEDIVALLLKAGENIQLSYDDESSSLTITSTASGGGPSTASIVVAAINTSANRKATADYVCDGVDDQQEINDALSAVAITGGKVVLLEGTYVVSGSINVPSNCTLEGQGDSTVIKVQDGLSTNIYMLQNSDTTNGNTNIRLKSFCIDGNNNNISSSLQYGVYFSKVTYSIIYGLNIKNCINYGIRCYSIGNCIISDNIIQDSTYYGMYLSSSLDVNFVVGNLCISNDSTGIWLNSFSRAVIAYNNISSNLQRGMQIQNSSSCVIVGNFCQSNSGASIDVSTGCSRTIIAHNYCDSNGIGVTFSNSYYVTVIGNYLKASSVKSMAMYDSEYCSVVGNICENISGTDYNIYVSGCGNSVIANNVCKSCKYNNIYLTSSTHNNIIGNTCLESSQAIDNAYDGIFITNASSYNNIQLNICRIGNLSNTPRYGIRIDTSDCEGNIVTNNDLYNSGSTASFSDAGTGTVTSAGNRL